MDFSMNATWSRAVDLVRDNFQLLVVIAGVFLLLPTMAAYLLIPDFQALIDPTADPDMVAERMAEIAAPLVAVGAIALVVNFAGYGAMVALMGRMRPTVGAALKTGFVIVPSLIAVLLLFIIIYMLGSIVLIAPISLLATAGGVPGLAAIGIVATLVFIVWLMARLSLSMPVLVLEDTLNPIKAMIRSFRLTSARQWSILLFWAVIFIVYMVISLVVTGVFSVIAALAGTGTAAMVILGLVNGVIAMAIGMLICAIAVAMFGQLAGPGAERIEQTFE